MTSVATKECVQKLVVPKHSSAQRCGFRPDWTPDGGSSHAEAPVLLECHLADLRLQAGWWFGAFSIFPYIGDILIIIFIIPISGKYHIDIHTYIYI